MGLSCLLRPICQNNKVKMIHINLILVFGFQLDLRRKQFHVLISSIHELQRILEGMNDYICLMIIIFNDHITIQNTLANSLESYLGCSSWGYTDHIMMS